MPSGNISKVQIAAACGEVLLFSVLGYYALKFIVNALDPTSKQKAEAKKVVWTFKSICCSSPVCMQIQTTLPTLLFNHIISHMLFVTASYCKCLAAKG